MKCHVENVIAKRQTAAEYLNELKNIRILKSQKIEQKICSEMAINEDTE
ncbi:hypothetical protein [Salegentibacter salinarum]